VSGIAIAHRFFAQSGFDGDHTASRKTIETGNGGSKRAVLRLLMRIISRGRPPKVGIGVDNRDNLLGIPRQLLHCCNTCGANEDESCPECGDRLYFVSAKPKMNF
jgi:hypothetical protein